MIKVPAGLFFVDDLNGSHLPGALVFGLHHFAISAFAQGFTWRGAVRETGGAKARAESG